jgi:DNA (cytosine-5)-methyltransferase 1
MPNFIDLFAGAGGLSEGFVRAGYTPIAHIEMNHDACDTLRTRAAYHWLRQNNKLDIYTQYLYTKKEKESGTWLWDRVPKEVIDSVIEKAIGEDTINDLFSQVDNLRKGRTIDVVIGGPPCQAYSIVGRARMGERVTDDPRNDLYRYYVKFLEYYRPKMFVFENVEGIRTAKGGEPFRDLERLVDKAGYKMEARVQVASQHGVLQNRRRYIIVGWLRDEKEFHYPELKVEENSYTIRKDLFADLPIRLAGEGGLVSPIEYTRSIEEMAYLRESGIRGDLPFTTQHIARPHNFNDRQIYRIAIEQWQKGKRLRYDQIPEALQRHKNKKTFLNRFQVVDPNGCSHTVVAHIAMDGHYYIYPIEHPTNDNVRSITIREAARIQSFPDDFFFEGCRSAAFKQIGNAVPVVMANKIAIALKTMLDS